MDILYIIQMNCPYNKYDVEIKFNKNGIYCPKITSLKYTKTWTNKHPYWANHCHELNVLQVYLQKLKYLRFYGNNYNIYLLNGNKRNASVELLEQQQTLRVSFSWLVSLTLQKVRHLVCIPA